jgi:hypothetical protein
MLSISDQIFQKSYLGGIEIDWIAQSLAVKNTYLASKKKWVNIDIFRNLPNRLMPQPHRRFKSYKLKKKLLFTYILNIKYLLSFHSERVRNVSIIKIYI